ncbi:MAG: PAS domain S-box protein [Bradyrhizobium sp.]|uniref:PAS domain S-box protein n=1 Tax=Bradyrhizobium sp. TaxID=376 RepID=UPI0025BD3654|nr:PAS domain S-box protein [Bradyrhizobium sp.]MBI5260693.1 PAS domain S-box protein [Bradyrhizobium sp.]
MIGDRMDTWRKLRDLRAVDFGTALVVAIAYLLAARLGLVIKAPEGVAQVWPAAGVAVGAMLILRPAVRPLIAVAVIAATVPAALLAGLEIGVGLIYAIANAGEALLVVALIDRWLPRPLTLTDLRSVLGLFGAVAVATCLWQPLIAWALQASGDMAFPFLMLWHRLVWSNVVGILMLAPVLVTLAAALRSPPPRQELIEGTLVLSLHALVSVHAFGLLGVDLGRWIMVAPLSNELPLLLWLAVRSGPLFAAIGSTVLGLAILGSFALGRGRFADPDFTLAERVLATQFGILVTTFVALAIAALIAERKRAEAAARRGEIRSLEDLDRAQAVAHTGSWRLDVNRNELSWSAESHRIFGLPEGTLMTYETFLGTVHPDDRALVDRNWQAAINGVPYDIEHRIVVGGEVKWVRERATLEFDASGKLLGAIGTCQDITDKKAAEQALRDSEERLRTIVDTAVDPIIIINDAGCIESVNPATARIFGYTPAEIVGNNVSMLMDEPYRSEHNGYIRSFLKTGEARIIGIGREVNGRRKDGTSFPADLAVVEWRLDGKRHFTGIMRDISERRRREEQVNLLLKEVNHRAKNMLAVVQAIARLTKGADRDQFVKRFSERIQALAANQDLLVESQWLGVELADLVRSQLAHLGDLIGGRITLEGPALRITARATQPLGMALHELATNAGKYGALSNSDGEVRIAWAIDRDGTGKDSFRLSWTERGGPEVCPPTRSGFGIAVIRDIPRMQLAATVTLDYARGGLTWRFACAAEKLLEHAGGAVETKEPAA